MTASGSTGSGPARRRHAASGRSRSTIALAALTLVALLTSAALVAVWVLQRPDSQEHLAHDLDGNQVAWEQPPDLTAAKVEPTGERFAVPGRGLDVPLQTAVVVDRTINPPTLTDAFLYRDFGNPDTPGTGPVVVAMHSVRGGNAPGNALVDPAGQGATGIRITAGDLIEVGGHTYQVTDVQAESKTETANNPRIWTSPDSDDLVVITCLLDNSVPLADQLNLVIFAEPTTR